MARVSSRKGWIPAARQPVKPSHFIPPPRRPVIHAPSLNPTNSSPLWTPLPPPPPPTPTPPESCDGAVLSDPLPPHLPLRGERLRGR
jgi:hypothetical protein